MRCHICQKVLSDKEISQHDVTKEFEPCLSCMEIILDTAYSDGFQAEDDDGLVVLSDFDDNTHGDFWSWYKSDVGEGED